MSYEPAPFFEPAPEPGEPEVPEIPPWAAPPADELGAVVPVERVVARSEHVVIALPAVRSFRIGCRFDIEVVGTRGTLPADRWWELRMSGYPVGWRGSGDDDRLPDRLLRLGFRFPDGSTATTVGHGASRVAAPVAAPTGPVLTWVPGGSGGGRRGGEQVMFDHFGLWLWPLPPARPIEFAVEWPLAGIELTVVELDGAALVAAAARATAYWAD